MSQYFPKSHEHYHGNIKAELDLPIYLIKSDIKGATGADISNLAAKSYLASLKADANEIDIEKLKPVSADLSKLSE